MAVDIYDGKVLIEALSTLVFSGARRGDELVSIDGRSVQSLIADFRKYAIAANPRSTDRAAAARLVSRSQQIMPHISSLGDTATLVCLLIRTSAAFCFHRAHTTSRWIIARVEMLHKAHRSATSGQ
jgi:hypothetical protein